ncbi:MAG: hypothetical protein ABII88_07590 [Candidatus Omnitrophota bacterium]
MKKGLILGLIIVLLCAANAMAQTAQIAVTVTITQSISVSVTPGSYAFGGTDSGQTLSTAAGAFVATNDGNGAENLAITVGDSANWTASTAAGADAFAMNAYIGATWALIDPASGVSLDAGLAPAGTQSFGLQLLVPTSTSNAGVEQTIPVTVTASAS